MNRLIKLMYGLAVALALSSLPLQASEGLKLGFVDLDRILRESGPAVRALKKLEKEFSGRDTELKKLVEQMRARQQDLEKGGLSLPEVERRNRERELVRTQQEITRLQRELREDYNVRRNEELAGIQDRVNSTIRQIANSDKYDVILQEAVYFNPRLDITDKVLKALAEKEK